MIHRSVTTIELRPYAPIATVFIGHNGGSSAHVLSNGTFQCVGSNIAHDTASGRSVTLYKSHDGDLLRSASTLVDRVLRCSAISRLTADIRLIDFHDTRHCRLGVWEIERMTNAVAHEPRCFVCDADFSVKLVRRYSLLRRAHASDGVDPMPKRNMAPLEDRSHSHCELLAAVVALLQSGTTGLTREFHRVSAPAVRAHGAIRPTEQLKIIAGLILRQSA